MQVHHLDPYLSSEISFNIWLIIVYTNIMTTIPTVFDLNVKLYKTRTAWNVIYIISGKVSRLLSQVLDLGSKFY